MTPRSLRYRLNPEYRAATLRRVKQRAAELRNDKLHKRIRSLRSRIWFLRGSISRHQERVEQLELDLLRDIERRDRLVAQWKRIHGDGRGKRKPAAA